MCTRSGGWSALVLVLGLSGVASAREVSIPFEWDRHSVRIEPMSDGASRVSLEGGTSLGEAGDAELPWIRATIDLYPGEAVTSWRWEPLETESLGRCVPAAVGLDRPEVEGGPIAVPLRLGGDVTRQPSAPVQSSGIERGRGVVRAAFWICPFTWDAETRELLWSSRGTLHVSLGSGAAIALPSLPAGRRDTPPASPGAASSLDLRGVSAVNPTPSPEGVPFSYLIVTTEALAPAFAPMAEWKARTGLPSAIQTVEWIYENYPQGLDGPEKIRLFLRDAYDYWGTQWVLLGGDPSLVPIRYAHSWAFNAAAGGTDVATDYYYACLDGDWNANGNSVYGEGRFLGRNPVPDLADLVPELHVGRVSARSTADVDLYWDKLRTYLTAPPADGFLSNALTMGEVLFDREWQVGDCDDCSTCPGQDCASSDGANDCFRMIDSVAVGPRGGFFQFRELYERDYWWIERGRPNAQPLNFTNAMSALNQGMHVVYQAGHGDRDRWAIGSHRIISADIAGLRNGDTDHWSALAYVVNCNSAAVDFDCLGEAWLFAPRGGGLVYIGSTNVDFPLAAQRHQNPFFHQWPGDGNLTLGEAHTRAVQSAASVVSENDSNIRFLTYSLIFLGDPNLRPWTSNPETMDVSAPATVVLGAETTEVTVELSGAPLAGALVCLYKAGDALATAVTNAQGVAAVDFHPTSGGTFLVTVTHRDGLPFTDDGQVVPPAGGFLALDGFTVSDENGVDGAVGNGNGQIEIGETVRIGIGVRNEGGAAATGATATLELGDVPEDVVVEVLDGTADLGSVAAGGGASVPGAFLVRISEGTAGEGALADLSRIAAEVLWASSAGTSGDDVVLDAMRPDLVLEFGDPVNQTDPGSAPEVDDNIAWTLQFVNRGSGEASQVRARIEALNPNYVTFRRSSTPLTPAAAGERAVTVDPFAFTIENTSNLRFDLFVEDTLESPARLLWRRTIDMTKPAPPDSVGAVGTPSTIRVSWPAARGTTNDGIWGYRVERASGAAGDYTPVGLGYVERTAYISDEDLPALTPFWYRVASIDSSGNRSAFTEPVQASTAVGALNGWPVFLSEQPEEFGCPTIDNIDGRGELEVLTNGDVLYAFRADGSDYVDGDESPSTRGKLFGLDVGRNVWGKPAVADLDGDGKPEIVCLAKNGQDGNNQPPGALIILDHDGTVKSNTPITNSVFISSPAIGNVDLDPTLEILFTGNSRLYGYNHDGTPIRAGNPEILNTASSGFFLYGSVGLGNFDADAQDEIVFTTRPADSGQARLYIVNGENGSSVNAQFPYAYSADGNAQEASNASPAIANIDLSDAAPEILITTRTRAWLFDPNRPTGVKVWDQQSTFQGGSLPVDIDVNPSPAVGNLDEDPELEVAYGWTRGRLYVRDALTGNPVAAYRTGGNPFLQVGGTNTQLGSPVLGDLDGDGRPEIVVGDLTGKVYAIRPNGSMMPGFPYTIGGRVTNGLAIWDVDRDGHPNLVIQSHQVTQVVTLDFPQAAFDPELASSTHPWPAFRRDHRNTGNLGTTDVVVPIAMAAPVVHGEGARGVRVEWETGHPFQYFRLERRADGSAAWSEVGAFAPEDVRVGGNRFAARDQVPAAGTWVYRVIAIDILGEESVTPESAIVVSDLPLAFRLHPAAPNPFRPSTRLELELPVETRATVRVFDPAGRVVATIVDRKLTAGRHSLVWDGADGDGRVVASGLYFIEASTSDGHRQVEKVVRMQ